MKSNATSRKLTAASGVFALAAGMGMFMLSAPAAYADDAAEFNFPESSTEEPLVLLTKGTADEPKPGTVKFSVDYPDGGTLAPGVYAVQYKDVAGTESENLTCIVDLDGKPRTYTGTDDVLGFVVDKETPIKGEDRGIECTVEVPATEENEVGDEDFHQGEAVFGYDGKASKAAHVFAVVGNDTEGIYPEDWEPGDVTDKYDWVYQTIEPTVPNVTVDTTKDQEKGEVPDTLEMTYTSLTPDEEYTAVTTVFNDDDKKVLETEQEFTPEKVGGVLEVDISELPDSTKGTEEYRVVTQLVKASGNNSNVIAQDEVTVTANAEGAALKIYQVDAKDKKTILTESKFAGWLCSQEDLDEGIPLGEEYLDEEVDVQAEAKADGVTCETLDKYDLTMDEDGNMVWSELKVRADGTKFLLLEETEAPEGYEPLHSKVTIMPNEDGKWDVSGGDDAWVDEKSGAIYIPSTKAKETPPPTEEPTPTDPPTEEPTPTDPPTEEPTPTDPPTEEPTPTDPPTEEPTPTDPPTEEPTPTDPPTDEPTPTDPPTEEPDPTEEPTEEPTAEPTTEPTAEPTETPTTDPPRTTSVNNNTGVPSDSGLNYYDEDLAKTGSDTSPGLLAGALGLVTLGLALIGRSLYMSRRPEEA